MTSVAYWINWLPEEVVASWYLETLPILKDAAQVIRVKEQLVTEERLLAERPAHRPQNRDHCTKYAGSPCGFSRLCFGDAAEDPLSSGYIWNERNHPEVVE